ncbi:hypothetical protein MMC17_010281 [Xylographa soralifera]|nr:hypothetical protein [Xylographa soralifera]
MGTCTCRTIVHDDLTSLIEVLDLPEQVNWVVEFHRLVPNYFILQSVVSPAITSKWQIIVQLWIQGNPFRITAIRSIASAGTAALLPSLQHPTLDRPFHIPEAKERRNAIIWQSKERGLQYQKDATVLSVEKPQTAKYLGFGEQGGKALFKDKTYMNYFNFDNMRYYNLYDEGPENDSAPLYHAESYWIEVIGNRYEDNYFVRDKRDLDPSAPEAKQQRYLQYGKGTRYFKDPNEGGLQDHVPRDVYNFEANFNSGWPFHGGVDYGGPKGASGFYPSLNSKEMRIWWGEQYKYLFDTGLEFVWQDMTSLCMAQEYGNMKSRPFRLLMDSDGWPRDPIAKQQKKVIEIWSLYSYNLHKATFKGLYKLDARKGKRNFIIGRGSFAGAQRYAGLWTGDNSSTWEFFNISVAQVLALGLAGVSMAGADVGGFEPAEGEEKYAHPELLIRWYCAYSLLSWLRNHYSEKENIKKFQEPYTYEKYYQENRQMIKEDERYFWESIMPVCRYHIRLRYSLLQLLYDAMFKNMIDGLPIARAMVISDPLDPSLTNGILAVKYLVRNGLLVAPALLPKEKRYRRKLYLPHPDSWWPMNLRLDSLGVHLE